MAKGNNLEDAVVQAVGEDSLSLPQNELATPFGATLTEGSVSDAATNIFNTITEAAVGNAGLLSPWPKAAYTSGARTKLKINHELVGFAFEVSWEIRTDQTIIRSIDEYLPVEIAPKLIMVSGSLGCFHIPGKGPAAKYWQGNIISFPFHRYITIEVRDRATDVLLLYIPQASITTRRESLRAEDLGKFTVDWVAIAWKDEIPVGYPRDVNDHVDKSDPMASLGKLVNPFK